MFTAKQRRIFEYPLPDGTTRWADPLRIRRRLQEHLGGELWTCWAKADEVRAAERQRNAYERDRYQAEQAGQPFDQPPPPPADGEAFEAVEYLLAAARYAFDLAELDPATGEGATESDLWACLGAYAEFMAKKDGGEGDTSASSSPSPVPSMPSSAGDGSPITTSSPST